MKEKRGRGTCLALCFSPAADCDILAHSGQHYKAPDITGRGAMTLMSLQHEPYDVRRVYAQAALYGPYLSTYKREYTHRPYR